MKLSLNTLQVLRARYLRRDDTQKVIETPPGLFRRVARAVAGAEKYFGPKAKTSECGEKFYSMMKKREFMPNSPTLMNAGTDMGQLSACFVVPVDDSIDGIFDALKAMAAIHKTGGGTGFSFSNLRPRGDLVSSTKGKASGPLSFMKIFDSATGVIVQGGRRRGANMGILKCSHPDIEEFIEAKAGGAFSNFNISVSVTDEFMKKIKNNGRYSLINPRNGMKIGEAGAGDIFNKIAKAAWRTGDPGLIFEDEINRCNPTPKLGRIEATNPCGELPLLPYESCNLASVNLAKMIKDGKVDWAKLGETVRWGVRFLDDVIEANKYPLPEIREMTRANRKIGLGVMGFADMLIETGIPYDSVEAVNVAKRLMSFIQEESFRESENLARERGVFPNFNKSVYAARGGMKLRNATVNTVAPTGTISIIAGCSSGIEPIFALSFVRNVLGGTRLTEVNGAFEAAAKKRKFYSRGLMEEAARRGSIKTIKGIPDDVKRIFVTAFDIDPRWHVRIQAAFQAYTDNSVSKTVNLPGRATVDDVKEIYLMAHRLNCKGITVYRYGAKRGQVLSFGGEGRDAVSTDAEYSGGCPDRLCVF